MRGVILALSIALLVPTTAAAVGASKVNRAASPTGLRIYDPTGKARSEVRSADVVRASVRASRQPGGTAVLFFRLTTNGARKFHSLTRALARRGARLRRPQRFAFAVNGRVYVRPIIDYRAFPDGFDGRTGVQAEGMKLATAQRLAREIRRG